MALFREVFKGVWLAALLVVAVAPALADVCAPSILPAAFVQNAPAPFQMNPRGQFLSVKPTLSGNVGYVDGCTLKFLNFTYLPDLGQTILYGSKNNDQFNFTSVFPVSTAHVNVATGTSIAPQFSLDLKYNLNDFNVLIVFSAMQQQFIASAKLYDLPAPQVNNTVAPLGAKNDASVALPALAAAAVVGGLALPAYLAFL